MKEISMRRFFGFAVAMVAMAGHTIVVDAQTFKVRKFNIGSDGGTD